MAELLGHGMKGIVDGLVIHLGEQFLKLGLVFWLRSGQRIGCENGENDDVSKVEHCVRSATYPAGSTRLPNSKRQGGTGEERKMRPGLNWDGA
jgi:hypothetical protein